MARAWHTPQRDEVLLRVYPTLKKISVDFAVMEPASADPAVTVAAMPMALNWLDVGSWPALAETCPHDDRGNALAAERPPAAGHLRLPGRLRRSGAPDRHYRLRGPDRGPHRHATLVCARIGRSRSRTYANWWKSGSAADMLDE